MPTLHPHMIPTIYIYIQVRRVYKWPLEIRPPLSPQTERRRDAIIINSIHHRSFKLPHPYFLNPSTPRVGTSINFNVGTPSARLLSTKLLHSITNNVHSASDLPEYLAFPACTPGGFILGTSSAVPGTWPISHVCAGAGRRGEESFLSLVKGCFCCLS